MKICKVCRHRNPDNANYCMSCGEKLETVGGNPQQPAISSGGNWHLFWITLVGSLVLSWLLMTVFHLPVFILGAVLPLVWYSRKK